MQYCLDTNVFITPSNFHYPMDFCPSYWDFLDENIENENMFVIEQVYQELTTGTGEVTDWVKERKSNKFVKSFEDDDTQEEFRKIADYVQKNYKLEVAAEFLSGADPWIISVCKVHEFTLVTKEVYSESKKKVPIPNICKILDVRYINEFEMIRELEAKFVLEK
jgi:hypothetical protein